MYILFSRRRRSASSMSQGKFVAASTMTTCNAERESRSLLSSRLTPSGTFSHLQATHGPEWSSRAKSTATSTTLACIPRSQFPVYSSSAHSFLNRIDSLFIATQQIYSFLLSSPLRGRGGSTQTDRQTLLIVDRYENLFADLLRKRKYNRRLPRYLLSPSLNFSPRAGGPDPRS